MPLVLGVTGSIATGKSGLCQYIVERFDAVHGDADKIVHRLFDPGKEGFDNAVREFGDEIVGDDGYIDRKRVGAIVFGNPEAMGRWTRAIGNIEDAMRTTVAEWRATLADDRIAILEAVNLIEANYSEWCDATWLVATENETAMRRMMDRDGFDEVEAQKRLDSQRAWTEREPASDHVFHNDGSLEDFLAEADAQMRWSLEHFRAATLPKSRWFEWRAANPRPRRPEGARAQRS